MILDSSALVAVVLREPGYEALLDKIAGASTIGIGAPTLAEAGIVLTAKLQRDPRTLLARLLQEFQIVTVPFGGEHWREAVEAYQRFGKGRHRASLNFGDCMAYATAKLSGRSILATGADFARTDLPAA